jgi:hypothetical protein
LIAAQTAAGIAERLGDLPLVGVARFDQRHHRIGLRRAIREVIVRGDDTVHGDDAMRPVRSEADAVIDREDLRRRVRIGVKQPVLATHGRAAWPSAPRSGKRTVFGPQGRAKFSPALRQTVLWLTPRFPRCFWGKTGRRPLRRHEKADSFWSHPCPTFARSSYDSRDHVRTSGLTPCGFSGFSVKESTPWSQGHR